jgi:methyl-accepting chemotaxis protein
MKFSIGKKQSAGMSALFIFVFIIGFFSLFQIRVISNKFDFMTTRIAQMERILTCKFYLQRAKEKLWLLQLDKRDVHRFDLEFSLNSYLRYFNYFRNEKRISEAERIKIADITSRMPQVRKLAKIYIELAKKGKWDAMQAYFKPFEAATERVLKELDETGKNIFEDVSEAELNNKASLKYSITFILALIIASFLIGTVSVVFLTRSLSRPILEVSAFAKSVSQNDLTRTIDSKFMKKSDETGELAKSVDKMRGNLNLIISEIKRNSSQLYTGVRNLSGAIQDNLATVEEFSANTQSISFASKEQVDFVENMLTSVSHIDESVDFIENNMTNQTKSFEEFSSSVEEMARSIESVARVSEKANKIAEELSGVANRGSSSIREVIEAVNGINEASKQIYSIMGVITGISEQTNLLAMNAAIEAAHAGEYGKGFAVVADEIRKLADTSSSSSKEIQKLLKDVTARIKNAVLLGNGADEGLVKIVSDIKNSAATNDEIFTATHQQSQGVREILLSISKLIEMAKDNSKTASEINNYIKDITEGIRKLKLISLDMQSSTNEQSLGSTEIVKLIEKENSALEKISAVTGELESFVSGFKVLGDKSEMALIPPEN